MYFSVIWFQAILCQRSKMLSALDDIDKGFFYFFQPIFNVAHYGQNFKKVQNLRDLRKFIIPTNAKKSKNGLNSAGGRYKVLPDRTHWDLLFSYNVLRCFMQQQIVTIIFQIYGTPSILVEIKSEKVNIC